MHVFQDELVVCMYFICVFFRVVSKQAISNKNDFLLSREKTLWCVPVKKAIIATFEFLTLQLDQSHCRHI